MASLIRFWTGFDKTLAQTTFVRVLQSTPVFSARCRPWDGLHGESGLPCASGLYGETTSEYCTTGVASNLRTWSAVVGLLGESGLPSGFSSKMERRGLVRLGFVVRYQEKEYYHSELDHQVNKRFGYRVRHHILSLFSGEWSSYMWENVGTTIIQYHHFAVLTLWVGLLRGLARWWKLPLI